MKIGLFAARQVGHGVARFFGENKEELSCLILDANDKTGQNSKIIEDSGVTGEKVFYSDSLYNDKTLKSLRLIGLDLLLLAWWPYIIKKNLIQMPRLGCLNFHPSYLPYNRGKNYNFWTLVEDSPFGVTLHWVDEGIDTGDIAFQSMIEKSWEDTGETLYSKAQEKLMELFREKFSEIKGGSIPRIAQDLKKGSFHKARELDGASRIELDKSYSARDLLNILRARTFSPHPAAWFLEEDEVYEVRIQINKLNNRGDSTNE